MNVFQKLLEDVKVIANHIRDFAKYASNKNITFGNLELVVFVSYPNILNKIGQTKNGMITFDLEKEEKTEVKDEN